METPAGGVRKCKNPECNNLTRSYRQTIADHPGTMARYGGYCIECNQPTTPPCAKCGVPLRKTSVPARLAPGTKQRYAEDMCKLCWLELNPPESPVEISPAQIRATAAALEGWLQERRRRLATA